MRVHCCCRDGDDPGDACIGSLFDDFVEPTCVVGEGEVGVGVDHGGMVGKSSLGRATMGYGCTTS